MSDLFDELAKSVGSTDATDRAKANMQRVLPKRFYTDVTIGNTEGKLSVLLDGKPVRTPTRNLLAVADQAVAERLVAEWAAQGTFIDPATMPLTRLVNSAIDGVAEAVEAVKDELKGYAGSDMICYRADGPGRLVARQTAAWDPVVAWAEAGLGVRIVLAEGVMHVAQSPALLDAVRARLPDDPLRLAAFHSATTLSGSVLLALALAEGFRSADDVWTAAHIDEDWNIELWGIDSEAEARRTYRRAEFDVAALALGRP
ncbi:ATP12 family chaperone protein [Oryzibacter oryziterrae]|uniref:ATP12 family chaperone protein n=1 Tax=Oryzibacter oryziterrae TaxID=2766474 RepID=UPI001F21C0C9|nr:ATP12 family protein [Oryzibacter oryziterrae]